MIDAEKISDEELKHVYVKYLEYKSLTENLLLLCDINGKIIAQYRRCMDNHEERIKLLEDQLKDK